MRKLLRFLRGYVRETILAPLFKMLEASFELIVPLVTAQIIDVGIRRQDAVFVWKMGFVMVALGLVGLACSLTAQYFAAKAAMGFSTALRRELFAHINSLSYRELDEIGTPALITRITSDVNQAQTGVNLTLRLFLRSPFIVAGALLMSFTIDVPVALIFLVAVPLISLVIYLIMRWTVPIYRDVQKLLDGISRLTRENYVGARVVRAFGRQKEEIADFTEENQAFTQVQMSAGKISALLNPATYVIMNLAIVAILWAGGRQVEAGRLTQGEVTALVNYMTQILLALLALANLIVAMTKAAASGARLSEVFAVTASLRDEAGQEIRPDFRSSRVSFQNVCFSYARSASPALEGITFSAEKGQVIGVIGGTGSGKSTLVNLIPRFYDAAHGAVEVDGHPVQDYPLEQLRKKIGAVPQRAVLFRGAIRENMRWGKEDASDEEIWRALEIAQAREFVEQKEGGLDAMIAQGGRNLSGGQRQRLTIARALVRNPEILILDDSASALDYATDAALRRALRKYASENGQETTVFLVSQRVASVRQADKILVLDEGRLAGMGTHGELLENCPVYKEICLSQLSEKEVAVP